MVVLVRRLRAGDRAWTAGAAARFDAWLAGLLRLDALPGPARMRMAGELFEAMKILSARIAAIGVDPDIARVSPDAQRSASPFLEQQGEVRDYVDGWVRALNDGATKPADDDRPLRVLLDQCREVVRRIRRNTGRTGVTVSLTFKLQGLQEIIDRLEMLLDLIDFTRGPRRRALHRDRPRAVVADAVLGRARRLRDRVHGDRQDPDRDDARAAAGRGRAGVAEPRARLRADPPGARHGRDQAAGNDRRADRRRARRRAGGPRPEVVGAARLRPAGAGGTQPVRRGARQRRRRAAARGAAHLAVDAGDRRRAGVGREGRGAAGAARPARPHRVRRGDRRGVPVPVGRDLELLRQPRGVPPSAAPGRADAAAGPAGRRGARRNGRRLRRAQLRCARRQLPLRLHARGVSLLGTLSGRPLDIRHVAFASANLGVATVTLWGNLAWQAVAIAAVGVVAIALTNLAVSFTLSMMLALRARRLDATGVGLPWGRVVRRALSRPLDLVRPPPAAVRDDARHTD
ncbi:MAG: hypothetical protein INH05_16095 [Burkholderiales bacterium]|nr:hypothetical protein [Burkholderiales bacterium]